MTGFLLALALICQTPDARGEVVTDTPAYAGVRADVPIPPELHQSNELDAGRSGLCSPTSVLTAGLYQRVPGLELGKESLFYRTAKARNAGGYGPAKLEQLVKETMPAGTGYASFVETTPKQLEGLVKAGYAPSITMRWGKLYGSRWIHHMVTLAHYRIGGMACIIDSNDPGRYYWFPASECDRRRVDGGYTWTWAWSHLPGLASGPLLAVIAVGLTLAFFVVVLFAFVATYMRTRAA